MKRPTVVDDDNGTITVQILGEEIRGWSYSNDDERRVKMQRARDYVEGWCDASEKIFSIFKRLLNKGVSEGEPH
jgi:hypothetical protein